MLHTKFRGNRPAGSGEEDVRRVFTIYGCGGHLGHVAQVPRTKFRPPYPRRLHIKFDFSEKMFEHCGRRTTDGRRTDDGRTTTDAGPWVYYKLTYEPSAQVS